MLINNGCNEPPTRVSDLIMSDIQLQVKARPLCPKSQCNAVSKKDTSERLLLEHTSASRLKTLPPYEGKANTGVEIVH